MNFVCERCGRRHSGRAPLWSCPDCGGLLDIDGDLDFAPLSLGEGKTPLVELDGLFLKLENLNPTGAFKDRGTAYLVGWMLAAGIEACLDDSSGNAGASLAAYCARAGIGCRLYTPASASGPKLRQIEAYGAELVPVEGSRAEVTKAARAAARNGLFYASHAHHPLVLAGMRTFAGEATAAGLAEDLDILYPVGQGTLFLGSYLGFGELGHLPRLHAVQAEACAPLAGRTPKGETRAEGIRITAPVRKEHILAAIRASGGSVVTVSEEEIDEAHRSLARRGFYVEPTSAAAYAGWQKLGSPRPALIPLTGSGLKSG